MDPLFSIIVGILLAVALSIAVLFPAYSQTRKEENNTVAAKSAVVKTAQKLSIGEVAKHRSESDCWLIVKGKVYDVTAYVDEHPGGESILNNAGGENTKGFYGPQHPRWVYERLEQYYIGDILE